MVETDLVKLAEREVIEAAKRWAAAYVINVPLILLKQETEEELLKAVTLLEERERQRDQLYDPDHLNPDKGGNRASDDYW